MKRGEPTMGGFNYILYSGSCYVVCKTAKYLRGVVDRNYFVDGEQFVDDYIKIFKKKINRIKFLKYSGRWD
jgi:hypothetical protein